MAALSGKNGKVRIASATLKVTEWSATPKTQKLDQTNSESGGFGEYLSGVLDCDPVSIKANFELGTTPLATLPPGAAVIGVVLYVNDTTNTGHMDCTLFVESFRIVSQVRALVTIEITGCSTGTFTTTGL